MPPFSRIHRLEMDFLFFTTNVVKTVTHQIEGKLYGLHLRLPNFTTTASGIVTIEDSDGYTIYTSASILKNTNTNLLAPATTYLPILITPSCVFKLTLNAGQSLGAGISEDAKLVAWLEGWGTT